MKVRTFKSIPVRSNNSGPRESRPPFWCKFRNYPEEEEERRTEGKGSRRRFFKEEMIQSSVCRAGSVRSEVTGSIFFSIINSLWLSHGSVTDSHYVQTIVN